MGVALHYREFHRAPITGSPFHSDTQGSDVRDQRSLVKWPLGLFALISYSGWA